MPYLKINSRKLLLAIVLTMISSLILIFKWNDCNFLQFLDYWMKFNLAIYTVYCGCNVISKWKQKYGD